MDLRAQIEETVEHIDDLNSKKGRLNDQLVTRSGDPGIARQLREINRELAQHYTYRDSLLKRHPELQREFGTPGRKKNRGTSHAVTRASITAADRARRKRLVHPEFKSWCAEERPQIKASLDNWEDDTIRDRFFRARIAPEGFEAWCEKVGKAFTHATWSGQNNQHAFRQWDDFKAFCVANGFPAVVANFRNDDIQSHFQSWLAEEKVRRSTEEKRELEVVMQAQKDKWARQLQERINQLPSSFLTFATTEWGLDKTNHSGILMLWDTDEDAQVLYKLWLEENVVE